MSNYDKIISWFEGNWITATILVIAGVLIALPQIRDGAVLLFNWIIHPFKKSNKSKKEVPVTFHVLGEEVSYTELLRSVDFDVVKVNAHTHVLGVAAEYEWLKQRYPGCKTLMQSLTSLELMKGEEYKADKSIHFDKIDIELKEGRKKQIFFDISCFFDGSGSSLFNSDSFIAKKIIDIYSKENNPLFVA